jgi:FHS family glucose/mannose:H+ symporter-like MFS transporter
MASVATIATAQKPPLLTSTSAAFLAFIPTGVVNVVLGPLLPALSARWSLNDAQAGALFTAQFLASTLGVVCSGILVPRFGYRIVLAIGLACMAIGVSTVPLGSSFLGIISISLYGAGFGVTIPAANLLVAEANPRRKAAALNLLNFAWSVGAVACPFLVAYFLRIGKIPLFLILLGGGILLVGALVAAADFPPAATIQDPTLSSQEPISRLFLTRSAIVLAILFFVYVGTENAVGGWLASYAKRMSDASSSNWVTTPSYFYGALLAGRLFVPLLLRKLHELKTARIGIALALTGVALLLGAQSVMAAGASACVIGLGLASIYPITIAQFSNRFGCGATKLGSVMFALAGVGAASVPWMVGALSAALSSLKLGLTLPLAGCAIMLVIYLQDWIGKPEQVRSGSEN